MNKPYAIYYHIWVPGSTVAWQLLVDEQIKRLIRARLHNLCNIYCCISGEMHAAVSSFVSQYKWMKIIENTSREEDFEGLTLRHLWQGARNIDSYKFVGYIHTKGIRYFSHTCEPKVFAAVNSWRHLLELSTIDNFRSHVNKLHNHDATGVGFKADPWPHFSGNMWWAAGRYIRTLPDPLQFEPPPVAHLNLSDVDNRRLRFERWIGSEYPTIFDFCQQPYFRDGQPVSAGFMDSYQEDITPYVADNCNFD